MPRLTDEDVEKMKETNSTVIRHELGFWYHTLYPDERFTDRHDALFNAMNKNELARLKAKGLNEHAQTPEQVKEFEKRKKVAEDRKRKAEMAAEIANQNK